MASLALGVKFVPVSNGTADFVYSAAVQGYRSPTSALTDGKTYRYRAESSDMSEWEYGTGVWSSSTSTLTRATVAFSSTGAKVSFTLAPQVGIIQFVEDVLQFDDAMTLSSAQQAQARANIGAGSDDPWAAQPIGVPIPLLDNIVGTAAPPTNQSYRYIKLTASDSYNTGVLTSESVTGSAPLVVATAVISLSGSPINGQTVNLINTEGRFLRGSTSAGTVQNDAFQGHRHQSSPGGLWAYSLGSSVSGSGNSGATTVSVLDPITDGTSGTPRTSSETRSKNIGVTFFMRIK